MEAIGLLRSLITDLLLCVEMSKLSNNMATNGNNERLEEKESKVGRARFELAAPAMSR